MTGLIGSAAPPTQPPMPATQAQQAQPQAPSPPPTTMTPGQTQAAPPPNQPPIMPSQQSVKNDLVMYFSKGLDIISNQQTRMSIVTMLKNGDPVKGLAATLDVVLHKLDSASRQAGTEVADSVKLIGALMLIKELAKVQAAAGIGKLTDDQVNLAFSVAIQDYIKTEVAAGRINPAKLAQQAQLAQAQASPQLKAQAQASYQKLQQTAVAYRGGQK